ncbi:hypothetical protein HYFRA_00007897 [Hymenoscyphus fraxineus]|uniref:Uncharacterized protein n=1 Tax=Hymenoscyphus fraxineus TaxID=746836 RepID=A0A9N9KQ96_9HELO|nr:hypothetical protein HYFRA_00007897 [Hymenoscyphus fraxineus]
MFWAYSDENAAPIQDAGYHQASLPLFTAVFPLCIRVTTRRLAAAVEILRTMRNVYGALCPSKHHQEPSFLGTPRPALAELGVLALRDLTTASQGQTPFGIMTGETWVVLGVVYRFWRFELFLSGLSTVGQSKQCKFGVLSKSTFQLASTAIIHDRL